GRSTPGRRASDVRPTLLGKESPPPKVDDSLNGAVLALGDETAGYPPDGNLRRAGANARPEIGQWLSKDGSETGHRLDRARRGEDAGGRVRVQTRSRRAILWSDPWPHS